MNTAFFNQSIAVVIGIDQYTKGIPSLRTAVNDARHLGALLRDNYGYHVIECVDEDATRESLSELFSKQLPTQLTPEDRLLIYFAGHGLAAASDGDPAGFLVPCDARDGDQATMLPMLEVQQHLATLPCRHLLLILDCCFAGAFRWASGRNLRVYQGPLYKERFARFVDSPAWQIITSAADDQRAADVLWRYGSRDDADQEHSPFARALFRGLEGDADLESPQIDGSRRRDGVITATDRILETHPRWDTHNPGRRSLGMIRGEYYVPAIEPGQHFVARVGFLAYYPSPNTNGVRITVRYNNTRIFEQVKQYDGKLLHIDEDLSQFAGEPGLLTIEVDTNGDSTQDWLSWVEAYIGVPKAQVVGSEGGCGS